MQANLNRPGRLPSTTSWLLAAGLLLSLLGLGSLARPALGPQAQASSRASASPTAQVVPASWRVAAP